MVEIESVVKFQRVWGMPSADTFDCEPIKGFVQKYLMRSTVSIDPFARNKRWATFTNDLNPHTAATEHLDAREFLKKLRAGGAKADLLIFDPPYSPRQISECYKSIGKVATGRDTQNSVLYSEVRELFDDVCTNDAIALSFGWNSAGMGKDWGEIIEVLLVCHGGAHNDTICMAERKRQEPRWF